MKALAIIKHLLLLLLVPGVIAAVSLYVYLQGGRYVSTDNAYIKHDIIAISSEIAGRVIEVIPRDNDRVTKGQLLFRIDDEPYRIALAKAEASLANVRAGIAGEKADILNSELDISKAEDDVEYRRKEMERIRQLVERRSFQSPQIC